MDDRFYTIRLPKRWTRVALIVVVTALVVAPLTAIATHTFTDVPDDHTFHNDITWLKDAGVTLGCNPPDNTRYCPDDNVTRGQMAAFIKRLAENQVVDAATAVTAEGVTHVQRVVSSSSPVNLAHEAARTHLATCPEGSIAMGGGAYSSHPRVLLEDSRPNPNGTAWQVLYRNMSGSTATNYTATVYVTCIQANESVLASASTQGVDTVDDKSG